MRTLYKIVGEHRARCSCGHVTHKGSPYYVVDTAGRAYSLCELCGKKQGLDRWWGAKQTLTSEQMQAHWFGQKPVEEVVCGQLRGYVKRSNTSSKREEMLRVAVEV